MSSPSESSIASKYHMEMCCVKRFGTLSEADDLATVLRSLSEVRENYDVITFAAGAYFVAVVPKVGTEV